jgi:hypothetical protein
VVVERQELEDFKNGVFARLNPLDTKVSLIEQAMVTHKEWEEEKFSHNGTAHTELRGDIKNLEDKYEGARPAIEWVMGIRRAWGHISKVLIVAVIVTAATAVMALYDLYKAVPGLGGGTP